MDIFLIKLLLSFIVGGLYIAFTISISEKYGSKLGGILTGLPSTVLLSLIFIVWTQNEQIAVEAVPIMPVAIATGSVFIVIFIHTYRKKYIISLLFGMLVWFAVLFPLILADLKDIRVSIVIAFVLYALSFRYLNKFPHRKVEHIRTGKKEIIFRIIFSGTVIAIAVFLGKTLGPLWGGLFASFPVAFLTSLVILSTKHGIEFSSSTARMMSYGSIGIVIFSISFYFTVPQFGFLLGIVLSYVLSLIYAVTLYKIIFK